MLEYLRFFKMKFILFHYVNKKVHKAVFNTVLNLKSQQSFHHLIYNHQ
jgi:hypothetical protein